jgi:hypothetical protein
VQRKPLPEPLIHADEREWQFANSMSQPIANRLAAATINKSIRFFGMGCAYRARIFVGSERRLGTELVWTWLWSSSRVQRPRPSFVAARGKVRLSRSLRKRIRELQHVQLRQLLAEAATW